MGLDTELDAFAQARGATTWKFPDKLNWKPSVMDKLADPNTPVHFNLNGVDVWRGVERASYGALEQIPKPIHVQAFLLQLAAETFYVPALLWLPRRNVHQRDLLLDAPHQKMSTGELERG